MTQEQMAVALHDQKRRLYGIGLRMLRHEQDALDALSETAYSACLKAHSVKDEGAVSAWLSAVMVNSCKMLIRKRRPTVDIEDVPLTADTHTDFDARMMIEALPRSDRQIMLLRYFGELNVAQIARELRMPESTIRFRIKRSLNVLRLQLEEV